MKTINLGYGFKRETTIIKNYGKQLNDIKSLIIKRFNLTILQAHKIIKALNRNGKVIFNNDKVAFMIKINSLVNKANKTFKTKSSSKVGSKYRVSFTYDNKYYTFVFRKSKTMIKPTYIRNISREYAPFKFDDEFINYLKSIIIKEGL